MKPSLIIIPSREAVAPGHLEEITLLLTLEPPSREDSRIRERPGLNLGIALDRSGSMDCGGKLDYAKQAIAHLFGQVEDDDIGSLTIFDNEVETVIPPTRGADRDKMIKTLSRILPGGRTALYDGWVESGIQVSKNQEKGKMNRVILLSDGLANVGETNSDLICSAVHGLKQRGISTSAIGVGSDFNEDLLQGMAECGDGSYHYIADPMQIPVIFDHELDGVVYTLGTGVTLELHPGAGVQSVKCLNEFAMDDSDRWMLPNLIAGQHREILLRLTLNPKKSNRRTDMKVCDLTLHYSDADGMSVKIKDSLHLDLVTPDQLRDMPRNEEVENRALFMLAAGLKREAAMAIDEGDRSLAGKILDEAELYLRELPPSEERQEDMDNLFHMRQLMATKRYSEFSKSGKYTQSLKKETVRITLRASGPSIDLEPKPPAGVSAPRPAVPPKK